MKLPSTATKRLAPVFRRSAPSVRLVNNASNAAARVSSRQLSTTSPCSTDGVFRGLTDTRLPTPWIEAFRLQQEGQTMEFAEAHNNKRDLTPKKMSDSYHRVVRDSAKHMWP